MTEDQETAGASAGRGGRRPPRLERSAGGVVLRRIEGEIRVLLIRDRFRKWGLPKGHVEPGEDDIRAALREVEEETGLSALIPGPEVTTIDWTFCIDGRRVHKYCSFFLIGSPAGDPVPEESEGITDCRWVALPQALEQISYENTRQVLETVADLVRDAGDPPHPAVR